MRRRSTLPHAREFSVVSTGGTWSKMNTGLSGFAAHAFAIVASYRFQSSHCGNTRNVKPLKTISSYASFGMPSRAFTFGNASSGFLESSSG